ncbi:uncharacterized protein EV420DRAFT_1527041 [Desarmillaria tabescens]|uniref:C2H2-type domain-containing protein n=1 Tax=Armillaria tabescens TaxID=1929756 RepID=A0AA39N9Z1_ARMTA|nr:uncharacterized protein EV420DRAFT_1527041 [Desarmillaria tabescens]KAK0461762.1 hypothetical protein EV420DRAFT_1527041 [Desarmillaria tabescens]
MSLERTNDSGTFTAESYRRNVQTIQAMQAHLEWMKVENERAELECKVREGEMARQQLLELQSLTAATVPSNVGHPHASNGPPIDRVQSSAYIEEVGYDHQLSSSRSTPGHHQPSTPYHSNGHVNYSPAPHATVPIVAQNSANLASHHPYTHRQTTSIHGPPTSGQDFRTSSLTNALGGTPRPPISYVQPSGPIAVQPTSVAAPDLTQSNNVQQHIAVKPGPLSTVRSEHPADLTQSASTKQHPGTFFSEHILNLNFNTTITKVRPWTADTLIQMLRRFGREAPINTHVDIPELRLRVAKLENSTVRLVMVNDQGQSIEVKDYSELQGLPRRLLARIDSLPIGAKTVVAPTRNINSSPDVNPARPDSGVLRTSSQSFGDPLLPPNKLASQSNQPLQSQAASRPYAASPEVSGNGILRNELADAGESSRSASPPLSNTLTPRVGSTLSRPRDVATSSSSSVLEGPRTPSHANKHTLARDVLRALGVPGKRGREGDSETEDERATKKRATDNSSTVSTTNSTSSTQAPKATVTGKPVTLPNPLSRPPKEKTYQYAPYGYYPHVTWTQPYNPTSTHPTTIQNTGTHGVQDQSTTADSRIQNSSSQEATSLLPVGASSTGSDQPVVEAVAAPSSNPTSTQNPSPTNNDTVADSNHEVSHTAGASLVQNYNAMASTSRSQSPIDVQEGDAGSSKLPLFFRSSSTPPDDTGGVDDVDHNGAEDVRILGPAEPLSAKAFGKRKIPYVLIPPPPKWVKEFKARLERRRHEAMFEEAGDVDVEVDGFESPTQQEIGSQQHSRTPALDPQEEAATRECSSRLREYPCKWSGCDSLLNCADRLYLHLQYHVEQNKAEKSFPCHWQHCGRVLLHKHEMISHLQAHAFMPLYCAYENCEETISLQKHQRDKLRPSADPVVLQEHIELPDVPSVVPSYMAVARSVAQYPISPERHQVIGLWTLQNIFGKVDLAPQRYNLAKPFRPGEMSAVELRNRHEYDFIETKPPFSSSPSRSAKWESVKGLTDLNSGEVTKIFKDKGIVLWGKGGDDDLVDETAQAGNDEEAVKVLLQV